MVVLGVGPRVGDLWLVLGLSHHYSWQGAWWAALLAGGPASPVGASGDADGEGAVGDVVGVGVAGDADGEGAAGDAPGDVVGEGGVGGALGVGVAGDADGLGAAGDALVDCVSGNALMVRVLLMMVLGVGPCKSWRRAWRVLLVCWFAGPGGVGRNWCRGSSWPGRGCRALC